MQKNHTKLGRKHSYANLENHHKDQNQIWKIMWYI